MQTGAKISAIGHGTLIALAVFGLPWFGPAEREPIRVTEVSFVSEAEFAAAQAAAPAEVAREETAPAAPPRPRPAPQPEPAKEEAAEPEAAEPEAAPAEATEPEPQVATIAPPSAATPPRVRPTPRIAPDPTPAPPQDVRPAETPKPAPTPDPTATARLEEPPAAPEEASPEPATEPAPPVPLALETSARPRHRPEEEVTQAEAVLAAVRQEAERQPKPETPKPPAPKPEKPKPEKPKTAAVTPDKPKTTGTAARPAPAAPPSQTTSTAAATSLPVGPPMTSGEKNGLKLAVQKCWNVPAGLRDANTLKVTLAAELAADGSVVNSSIRLIEPSPAPDGRYQQAYEAGRRALIRCSPYSDLPRDKFAQWRNIEVVFNPEGMVSW